MLMLHLKHFVVNVESAVRETGNFHSWFCVALPSVTCTDSNKVPAHTVRIVLVCAVL